MSKISLPSVAEDPSLCYSFIFSPLPDVSYDLGSKIRCECKGHEASAVGFVLEMCSCTVFIVEMGSHSRPVEHRLRLKIDLKGVVSLDVVLPLSAFIDKLL